MKPLTILSIAAALHLLLPGRFTDAGAQHRSVASGTMDWQSWGGPNGNFTVSDAGVLQPSQPYTLKVVWRKQLGTGYSGISIRDHLVVTMFSDGTSDYVIGLDADDGSERWRHRIGPTYLGHYGSQNGPVSTPLLTDNKVIALSPRGSLFALDAKSGRKLWAVDLVQGHQGIAPFWGFTTAPLMHDNLLIVQTGGSKENAISAFNPDTGDRVWSACSDTVDYQSPRVFRLGDREHLVFHGNRYLFGLDPGTGDLLWTFAHGGQSNAASTSGHPVEVAEGRYFVKNRANGGVLLSVSAADGACSVEEVWRTRHIRGTYIYVVHHGGYLYGYNGRILTCVDAETGERAWRSREPGDGLPIVVDRHLVIITKDGKLAIARASGEGYSESARLELFDDIAWSPASFANGRLYARSMSEIACVETVPKAPAAEEEEAQLAGIVPDSRFAAFVEAVNRASDKVPLIERFISEQETFPVIEGDSLVHFVYRGEADEVALTGDLVGRRTDQPMNRIDGTDLFYYSSTLEPDARITYRYTLDLQEAVPDPLNPRGIRSLYFGHASWFGMPQWRAPDHLEARQDGIHGRVDSVRFESASIEGDRILKVYLPAGYDRNGGRYPVAYVHAAHRPLKLGRMDVSLDNIIGKSVHPVLVVFIPSLVGRGYSEYAGSRRDEYARIFVDEIVPFVDRTYRTIPNRAHRANVGAVYGAFMAFYATFTHPDVFGNLAIQTMYWDRTAEAEDEGLVVPASSRPPLRIYMDWGKYDLRNPMEGNDLGESSRSFARLLQARGYFFAGGMVNDGVGWASWRNRTDRVFETLFPISD